MKTFIKLLLITVSFIALMYGSAFVLNIITANPYLEVIIILFLIYLFIKNIHKINFKFLFFLLLHSILLMLAVLIPTMCIFHYLVQLI